MIGTPQDPRDLALTLHVDLDNVTTSTPKSKPKADKAETNGQAQTNGQRPRGKRAKTKPFDLDQYPAVKAALDKDSGDRSADTQHVVAVCFRAGLRFKQACWAVYQSDRLTERLEERNEDHGIDLQRCWNIAVDEGQRKQQDRQRAENYCPTNDVAIGERIVRHHLDGKYIRTGGLGWLHFDGRKWGRVDECVVYEQVRKAVKEIYRFEADKADSDAARLKTLAGLLSAARIGAFLRIIKGMLTTEDERLNNHPDLLNVGNGVLNLATGELTPHDPELKFTKVCETRYVAGATHPDWDSALSALPEDAGEWLQTRLGQALTGHAPPDDVIPFWRGGGENGKSTFVDAILGSVGDDYAVVVPERVLLANPGDHPTEKMTLLGARMAFMEELPELGHLNVKRLKAVSGGQTMDARLCGRDTVTWHATHSLFVTTNYAPRVDESDHGTWRRLAMLVFPYRYRKAWESLDTPYDRRGDPGLRQRLRNPDEARAEAVVAWLVEGALAWYRNGRVMPAPPQSVLDATKEWRKGADLLLQYVEDTLVLDAGRHIRATGLYDDFSQWLKGHGHRSWTDKKFSDRLEQHSSITGLCHDRVRASTPGLSRKPGLSDREEVPNRFWAWTGIRYRESADDGDDDEK
jgi:P4 family phage/plasmid primase-like protien